MGKQSRQALSERADIASQGRENTQKAGTKTLSPKYCWVFCGQRKYPSFCSLKKMETEAHASTHRGYQETQAVWQDSQKETSYAENNILDVVLPPCCKTSSKLGSGWPAELQSCSSNTDKQLVRDHKKRISALQEQWTGCQKIHHKMVHSCLNFWTTGREIPPKTVE